MPVGDASSRTEQRGFFEAWAECLFKVDTQGHLLFFPWGIFGRGYVVPSQQRHEGLLNVQAKLLKLSLIGSIVIVSLAQPPLLALLVLPPFYLGYSLWLRRTTRGWLLSTERLSIRESLAAQSNAFGRPLLWTLLLGSLLFVLAGIWLLAVRPDEWLTSTAAILFFGLCSAAYARMLFQGDAR